MTVLACRAKPSDVRITYDQSTNQVSHLVWIDVPLVRHLYHLRCGPTLLERALGKRRSVRLAQQASVVLHLFSLAADDFSKYPCKRGIKLTASRDR